MSSDPTDPEVLLSATALRTQVGTFTVGPIDLAVRAGTHVGIMGASGSGKSTLLRTLALLQLPTGGEVSGLGLTVRHGTKITERDIAVYRRGIGLVGQGSSLWPHLTIQQNVEFGPRHVLKLPLEECARATSQLLEGLKIGHLGERRTWQISGGEAKRAAVARALAVRPRILLLDEVESGLDPMHAAHQMDLVTHMCNEVGASAILVTHTPWIAARYTRWLMVLDAGRVVECGATSSIMESPKSRSTQALLDRVVVVPAHLSTGESPPTVPAPLLE
jgi:ABC-type Fe3+/spermidine/putrescine transport system ATPase subunit